ncbi:MAG: signal peptidase I [Salinigranum sp.]
MRARYAVVLIGVAVLASALGAGPIRLSYVTSGSMTPLLHPGDGYLLYTWGTARVGDVVTYRSQVHGGYVTHRVVGRTDEGFLTRGDANPSTDQAGGEPPVPRSEIVGRVLTVGGRPLVLPALGVAADAVRSHAIEAFGILACAALVARNGRRPGRRERSTLRPDDVMVPLVLGLLGGCLLLSVLSGSAHQVALAGHDQGPTAGGAVEGPAGTVGGAGGVGGTGGVGRPDGVDGDGGPGGTSRDANRVSIAVGGPPFADHVVTVDGARIERRALSGSRIDLWIRPPAGVDRPRPTVRVHPYPATLPHGALRALYDVDPFLAAAGSLAPVFVPFWLAYRLVIDGKTPLRFEAGAVGRRLRRVRR